MSQEGNAHDAARFGIVRFDDRFMPEDMRAQAQGLLPRAQEALAQLRTRASDPRDWVGWFDWPARRAGGLARELMSLRDDLGVFYDTVVVVGIGGSYLGCRAAAEALSSTTEHLTTGGGNRRKPLLVYAGQHLSESALLDTLELLEGRQPIVNVVSKSGTTTEPALAFRFLRDHLERRFGKAEAAKRIIATTDPEKGALRKLAQESGYRTFPVPSDVGGRYSVLTAVGLVPLALAGLDVDALLAGADAMFATLRGGDASQHPALRYAAARTAAYAAGKRIELLSYAEPRLAQFTEWWKQLFGESEGKDGKGLFPAGLAYTTDLHSLGQYVQEGVRDLLETYLMIDAPTSRDGGGAERRLKVPSGSPVDELGYLEGRYVDEASHAALDATRVAHADGGVPCLALGLSRLGARELGGLFAFFETACAVSASLLGVDAFDQPGVEAYKKNLFGLLGKPGFESLGAAVRRRL
jgi:glucose-6-phosphate isomerase